MESLNVIKNAETIDEAVGLAVGAASTCWENPGGAGVFQSERASEVVDALLERINKKYPHEDGEFIIIGPECFSNRDRTLISWQGENYRSEDVL